MLAITVATGVVAVALLVWAAVAQRGVAQRNREITQLEARVEGLGRDVAEATERAELGEAAAREATARANRAEARVTAAEAESAGANQAAAAATERAAEAATVAARADERADRAQAELSRLRATAGTTGHWSLQRRRVLRLWRDRLSLPGEPSPFEGRDPAEGAVRVFAEASREESGVAVDVVWTVEAPLAPEDGLAVLELAEELISEARSAGGAELEVRGGPGALEVRLRTDPPAPVAEDLAQATAGLGWRLVGEDGVLVARTGGDEAG